MCSERRRLDEALKDPYGPGALTAVARRGGIEQEHVADQAGDAGLTG
jgi:hypothetical protein